MIRWAKCHGCKNAKVGSDSDPCKSCHMIPSGFVPTMITTDIGLQCGACGGFSRGIGGGKFKCKLCETIY
tara:strand:- start:272 stop:481 length:210 start_codon:yes stop_codon:yes gene_type:complete